MDALGPPADPPGSFLRPLVISLTIVAGIALSLITYHIILVKYCARRQRRIANSQSAPVQTSENMGLGVEEHVLKEIPVVVFSSNNTKLAQKECVICLGDLEEGDEVRSLPNCGHLFHIPCIDDWLSAHTNCPICRAPILATTTIDISCVLEDSGREPMAQNSEGDDQDGASTNDNGSSSNNNASSSSSSVVFRHSLSLILPMEEKPQSLRVLKRSLSMDQWSVIIDIKGDEIENASATYSPSSSSSSSSSSYSLKGFLSDYRSYNKARSMRQIDRVSSRLLRSFSQMRLAQSALPCRNLPY